MRKTILIAGLFLWAGGLTSCLKDKDYTCHCTYVANSGGPNAGSPNKDEDNNVKGKTSDDAAIDCLGLEGKYNSQFYQGTCLLK